jgi:hypothetical protein
MKSILRIYTPLGSNVYELCHPVSQDDFETINVGIDGTPRHSSWKPIAMELIHEDRGHKLAKSDSPWLGAHALIFRSSVIAALGAMLSEWGELLPLRCSEAELVLYNPIRVVDALDEAASSVRRFTDGRIMFIQRHAFRADVIGDLDVFKIPNLRVSPTFLSQRFVDRWNASGLKGLEFKEVWAAPP